MLKVPRQIAGYGETQEEAEAPHDQNRRMLPYRVRGQSQVEEAENEAEADKSNIHGPRNQKGFRSDLYKAKAVSGMPKPTFKRETLLGFYQNCLR